MNTFATIIIFATVYLVANTRAKNYIIGGEKGSIKQLPYIASLRVWDYHICGASILSTKWAMTAAHCVTRDDLYGYTLVTGTDDMFAEGTNYELQGIIPHQHFDKRRMDNDLAMLKIHGEISFDATTAPVGLPKADMELISGLIVTVAGWGYTKEKGTASRNLMMTRLNLIERSKCQMNYLDYRDITEGMICAEREGRDACQGDSGGPLVFEGLLVGVVSWGKGCARPGYPGVYTNVLHYLRWIATTTNNDTDLFGSNSSIMDIDI